MLLLAFSPCFTANSPRSTLVSQVLAASFVGDLEVEQVEPVIIGPMKLGTTTAEKNGANSEWGKSPKYRVKMINSYSFFSMIEFIQQTIQYTCFWYVFGMYAIKVRVARHFAIQIAGASNNRHEQSMLWRTVSYWQIACWRSVAVIPCGFQQRFLHKQAILIDLDMANHETTSQLHGGAGWATDDVRLPGSTAAFRCWRAMTWSMTDSCWRFGDLDVRYRPCSKQHLKYPMSIQSLEEMWNTERTWYLYIIS